MKTIEKQAKTVDEAIKLALEELNANREDVEIEILEEGNKGILGFLSKAARVRVTLKEKAVDKAKKFVEDIVKLFDLESKVTAEESNNQVKINLEGKDVGILIGRRGNTLDALQYLTTLVTNKNENKFTRIIIDAENYRQRREESLRRLAKNMARKVKERRKNIVLEPMTPGDRRIIHTELQHDSAVTTKSIGDEPYRKIVISIK